MVDVFEEVEEQIRVERWKAFGLKILPWAAVAVVALVLLAGGLWGWDYWSRSQGEKAAQTYVEALKAVSAGDETKAYSLLEEVAKSPAKGYPAMALMAQAGLRERAGKTAEAVTLLDKAADKASDPMIADLARLKSALALLDTAPYKDLEARLTPLMAEKRPYRLEAREALAFAKIMNGKPADARTDFVFLTNVLGAPDTMRQRARAATALIDSGSASSIPAIVKAAATLPPQGPVLPQGMTAPPQAQQGPAQ
ncbi:MAG: tetratricopeptide repeat protein [Caulobacter sp.]|nr:tetratricopeptide repeat protein [Caulobacter sp.]